MTPSQWVFLSSLLALGVIAVDERGLGYVTDREKPLVTQLRGKVKAELTQPIMHEDQYLVRFLRAQKHNLNDAADMIRRNLAWRRDERMDTILSEDWTQWLREVPWSLNIVDYTGKPAFASRLGKLDVRKVMLSGRQAEVDRYMAYIYERALYNVHQAAVKTGRGFVDGYLLFNLAGYTPRTHGCFACLPSWLKLVVNYESYYAELAAKMLLINTPRIFDSLLNILKSVISARTFRIIKIYDYNKDEYGKELIKIFPKDVLPVEFGGTGPFIPFTSLHKQNVTKIIFF